MSERERGGRTWSFLDLSEDAFPFRIELFDEVTRELLWEQTVEGPGALRIPGFGRPVRGRMTFLRTGDQMTVGPDGHWESV